MTVTHQHRALAFFLAGIATSATASASGSAAGNAPASLSNGAPASAPVSSIEAGVKLGSWFLTSGQIDLLASAEVDLHISPRAEVGLFGLLLPLHLSRPELVIGPELRLFGEAQGTSEYLELSATEIHDQGDVMLATAIFGVEWHFARFVLPVGIGVTYLFLNHEVPGGPIRLDPGLYPAAETGLRYRFR